MSMTDEQIAAYADGELTGEELAAAEAAISNDPAIARKVEVHRALRSQLGEHFAPVLEQPVPERLTSLLQGEAAMDNVASFAAARQKRGLPPAVRRWAPIAGPAIAAALALAVLVPGTGGNDVPDGYAGATLAAALDQQLVSEQGPDAATRILLSFEDQQGQLCRTFRSGESGGIACRDHTGWKLEVGMMLDRAQSTQFRQAGSEAELMEAAQDMAAGGALTAEQEAAARERDWR